MYAYDAANRLVSVNDGVSTTTYAYSGDGDRVSQTVAGVTTSYVIDIAMPLTMVLAETTGTETIYYLHGLDLIAQSDGASAEYFAYDGLGSVRQVVNDMGEVLLAQGFDPYGNPYISAGNGVTSWGFTGEQTDENRLVFLRARYYQPRQGRFLNLDPFSGSIEYPATLNPYLYGLNNPLLHTDPSGMFPECDPFQRADLTLWLMDEMNENRKSYIFTAIWTGLHSPELFELLFPSFREYKIPAVLVAYGLGYGLFYDVVKTNGLWDFKWEINDQIGIYIRISEEWYRNDFPGNMHYGFIGLAAGFDRQILHCGADYATNGIPCSGSDPMEDYEAIEAGYELLELSGWGPVKEEMLKIVLDKRPLLALGIAREPNALSASLPWPYPAGSFDDGSSGWVIKQR